MSPKRFFRCDAPLTGPIVLWVGPAAEGYARVKSLLRGTVFETRIDRLYPL